VLCTRRRRDDADDQKTDHRDDPSKTAPLRLAGWGSGRKNVFRRGSAGGVNGRRRANDRRSAACGADFTGNEDPFLHREQRIVERLYCAISRGGRKL